MFYTVDDFLKSWLYESAVTLRLFNELTDESLKQEITQENWSLGRVAWHIVTAIRGMTEPTGLAFVAESEDFPVPPSAKFIADSYSQASESFFNAVVSQWPNNEVLDETVNFFGREMRIGMVLQFLIQHQIHHRGQMTVLMRQAGLSVPGIYGPSKEEWEQMGMEAPQM
jgi:uncharacterized damage-inducible protein DinB